ncbi:MAG TPA: flagellar hook-basal body complex protein FliE [Baekduia sp.]|jgi:flagellar hook-basal body complex protein FliE
MIDPSMAIKGITGGPEFSVGSLDGAPTAAPTQGASFGSMLGDQLSSLEKTQTSAADASRSLADGTATDPSQAVVSVERAQLSMQLAAQLRTKGVEALQEIFHTAV